jgi:predicted negative regulator of RcsB-dependent stress response
MSKIGKDKDKRILRKLDAIDRKQKKIDTMKKTLETPSEMDGQGWNPTKDYHEGTLLAAIKRKEDAIRRKKRKLGIEE